jgi:outer membrane protein assembly factor BamB
MRCTILVLFLMGLAMLPARAAPVPERAPASQPLPGGVADPDGKVGFVTGADGGIDALDLASGKVLWTSKVTQRAVAVDGKHLLALASVAGKGNALQVVTLDATDGKKLAVSDPVTFPDWVVVRLGVVTTDAGRSFAATVKVDKGDLYLRWQARSWYWGGARPTPEIEAAARKNADGLSRINLESGKVAAAEKWPVDAGVSAVVEKVATRPVPGVPNENRVTVVGDLAVAVDVEGKKAVLKRWQLKDAKPLEPVELLEAPAFRIEMSPESGRVLVHKAVAKEALPQGDYAWWIFDLATGKQVGKLEFIPTTREVGLVGSRAFFVVNPPSKGPGPGPFGGFTTLRSLQAVDIATGKKMWEHNLEPERRMPPPP